jgi:hypothetical protein
MHAKRERSINEVNPSNPDKNEKTAGKGGEGARGGGGGGRGLEQTTRSHNSCCRASKNSSWALRLKNAEVGRITVLSLKEGWWWGGRCMHLFSFISTLVSVRIASDEEDSSEESEASLCSQVGRNI